MATNDPTARFFAELAERGHEPLLRKASGAMRFDLRDGMKMRRWVLAIDSGDIAVTQGGGDVTCVLRADKTVFDRVAGGRMNAVAAVLRGELEVSGDWRMLVRLQRLFPSPPRKRRRPA